MNKHSKSVDSNFKVGIAIKEFALNLLKDKFQLVLLF